MKNSSVFEFEDYLTDTVMVEKTANKVMYDIHKMAERIKVLGRPLTNEEYIEACEERRKSVEKALAIVMTATNGPDEKFMDVLDSYIMGNISLEEMEARIDRLEYLE